MNMQIFKEVLENPIGYLLCTIILFALIAYAGNKVSLCIINKISQRIDPLALHWKLFKYAIKIIWAIIFILGIIESVPYLNNVSTALVACSSVIFAAIGLASQDVLKDAIDGIFISFFKPFSVGDRIRLVEKSITGTVVDINFRFTSIKTVENNVLMIPNSVMNDQIIENSNIVDTKIKAFIDVTVGYDSDIKLVKKILEDIITKHPMFIDTRTQEEINNGVKPVTIMVRELAASGVDIRATVCSGNISDSFQMCSDLREAILVEFKEQHIDIPYQTITINQ